MLASLPLRLARAAAFAVVCLGLAVLAHVFAGGSVPVPSVLSGFALSFAAALALAARERGFWTVAGLLTAVQVVLHLQFTASHGAADLLPALEPLAPGCLDLLPGASAHGHAGSGLVPGLGMLVLHSFAVVLTALWLARGEAALWALLRRLAVRLRLVWPAPLVVSAWPSAPHREPGILRSAVLRHSVSGRAPPLLSIA